MVLHDFITSCFSYANHERYSRAVEDFEAALDLNPRHANARKYLLETLTAHARRSDFNIGIFH